MLQKKQSIKSICSMVLVIVLLCQLAVPVLAQEQSEDLWEDHNVARSFNYRDIELSIDGQYVIVGDHGGILYSKDSENWSKADSATRSTLFGCTWGSDLFVAVGMDGTIVTSQDGIEWTLVYNNDEVLFEDVVYGKSGFVAVGSEPNQVNNDDKRYIYYSKDGLHWEQVLFYEAPSIWRKVSYMNNIYIAHDSYYDDIAYSKDGINWHVIEGTLPINNNDIIWNGSNYISLGSEVVEAENGKLKSIPHVYRSPDLMDWTEMDTDLKDGTYIFQIARYKSYYIMLTSKGEGSHILASEDFREWEPFIDRTYDSLEGLVTNFDDLTLVGFNSTTIKVADGRAMSRVTYNSHITKVLYNGESYLAVGHEGSCYTSENGKSWIQQDSNIEYLLRDAIWVKDKYYAIRVVPDDNSDEYTSVQIYTSEDGIDWALSSTIGNENLRLIQYCNNKFFALGTEGEIYWSNDAKEWEKAESNTDATLRALNWLNGKYYAVGMFGTLVTSEDGMKWSYEKLGNGNDLNDIATNGSSLMIVGDFMETYLTTDGLTWTTQQKYKTPDYENVLWDGSDYVIFSYYGDYTKTKDGINFTQYSTDMYEDVSTVCWDGEKYIVAGRDGTLSCATPTDFTKIVINSKPVKFDVAPQVIDGRTMIPARAVFEKVGAKVSWDNTTKSVVIDTTETSIAITIGSNTAMVNGEEKVLEAPAVIVEGRTLVPLRFISEELGMTIEWDGDTKTATIVK